ncbi:MAG TPA: VWA domain-containing protein [Pyrinomonadaceae bacterium]|nr:VWA domain-containing protein [Pyrinomonadaceae bacterium]
MKRFYFLSLIALLSFPLASELASRTGFAQTRPAIAPATTPTPAIKPAPTIREEDIVEKVETELVNLNVRVVDRNNRPIGNLKQGEFKIYEDNVLQQIDFFSVSEVPTNYSLVIDNSGSLRPLIDQVIEAGKILVQANKPGDETSIIRFVSSDKIEVVEDFTKNKADLVDALDTKLYIEGGQTAIIDAVYLAAQQITKYDEKANNVDRKRKALILVSDGEDRTSFYTQQQLFDLLRESDVQIYVVGFIKELSADKSFISKSPQGKAKAFLERLATETGGKAYFPNAVTELNGIARDIASELRTQYSIGYLPSNDRKDGTYRNIKVVVNDGPNSQKRIPLTRSGRTAETEPGAGPTLQRPGQISKEN